MMRGFGFLAALSLARSSALSAVLGVAAAVTVLTLFSYSKIPMFGWRKRVAVLLKLGAFYSLIACWVEPQWVTRVPKERANSVAMLLDDSKSMQLPDSVDGVTRGARLIQEWANGAASWRPELDRDFRVRSFAFASCARELGQFVEMNFQGSPTSLATSIAEVIERVGDGVAGIVVFTDGVASDLRGLRTSGLPPIFPVVFGREDAAPDLSLGMVSTTQSAFEDSPVTVAAEVKMAGLRPLNARARIEFCDPVLSSGTFSALSEAWVQLSPEQPRGMVQLQFTPPRSGPTFYRIHVDATEIQPEAELTLENNRRMVCVNRASGPHRVLYVAGRPNWEFGPLRRAIEGDSEVELRGLIRIAKREPKFSFKGRGGEASNPLFRGFQTGDDTELQRYDKPVIIRVNVDSADELAGGFPKTAEELFSYKGVILDDVESAFFTPDQLRLIQRFVAERGGGMLMLGGMESFEGGGWRGTPIEAVLPVWMGKDSAGESGRQPQRWALTREGLLEPWVRRRKSEAEELSRMARLPGLEIVNHVEGVKPAATVLAVATVESERNVALVTQRYGTGRCGAVLAGDLFHWGIGDPAQVSDLTKLWRQIIRWLVADVPTPVEITAEWNAAAQSAKLSVRVRDSAARPVEDADIEVRVRRLGDPESSAIIIRPDAAAEPGSYSLFYSSQASGALVAEARAIGPGGIALGTATVGWVQDSSDVEFSTAAPDRSGMDDLAKRTGGEVIRIEDLSELPSKLRKTPNLAMESRVRPLWHTSWFFGFSLLCLCGEWILKRRNGAA
jgi:uncharacterized membrane protein